VLGAAPVTAVMLNLLGTIPTPIWVVLVLHLGYLGVPVATGFAVLRYRLYDVDRIVGGSVVLAVLVVLAGAGYVLAVGLVGVVAANEQSTLFSLVIFVVVVLVFQPIRSTVRRLADRFVYGPQSMSYEALTTFTRQLSSSTTEPFLDGVAEAAGRLVSARGCRAVLILEDGTELTSSWSSTGAHSPAGAGTTDVSSDWLIPVVHGATTLGRLELSMPELAAGSGRRRQLLQAFGQRVAAGFDHARLELSLRESAEQLKEMNHQLVQSRQRLLAAKDIGQRQVATKMRRDVIDPLQSVSPRLEQVAELALTDPTAAAREVGLALQSTTVAIQQLRAITSTVYSRVLVERGLVAALRAESWPAGVSLELRGSAERWSPLVESALFACCIDFIRTARGRVVVQLVEQSAQTIELTLNRPQMSDDDEWLATTTERIEVMGGHVVRLRPDTVRLRLPVVEARAAAEHASRQLQP
jgi:GAF domain-containing protein